MLVHPQRVKAIASAKLNNDRVDAETNPARAAHAIWVKRQLTPAAVLWPESANSIDSITGSLASHLPAFGIEYNMDSPQEAAV